MSSLFIQPWLEATSRKLSLMLTAVPAVCGRRLTFPQCHCTTLTNMISLDWVDGQWINSQSNLLYYQQKLQSSCLIVTRTSQKVIHRFDSLWKGLRVKEELINFSYQLAKERTGSGCGFSQQGILPEFYATPSNIKYQ